MKINVYIAAQQLELLDDAGKLLRRYAVSTAANGAGETCGSYCTPRGKHIIRAKIGAGQPENTVFVRRRPTGEIYTPELGAQFPERDWILTRILWLSGCEVGFNRLGDNDTMRRGRPTLRRRARTRPRRPSIRGSASASSPRCASSRAIRARKCARPSRTCSRRTWASRESRRSPLS